MYTVLLIITVSTNRFLSLRLRHLTNKGEKMKTIVRHVSWIIFLCVSSMNFSSLVSAQEMGTADVNPLLEGGLPVTDLAAAAASCYGSGCNGVNPQGTACQQSAYRVFGYGYPVGMASSIELWYSPSCKANWARLIVNKSTYSGLGVGVWLLQYGSPQKEFPKSHIGFGGVKSGYIWWSPMRDGAFTYEAWGSITVPHGWEDGHTPGG